MPRCTGTAGHWQERGDLGQHMLHQWRQTLQLVVHHGRAVPSIAPPFQHWNGATLLTNQSAAIKRGSCPPSRPWPVARAPRPVWHRLPARHVAHLRSATCAPGLRCGVPLVSGSPGTFPGVRDLGRGCQWPAMRPLPYRYPRPHAGPQRLPAAQARRFTLTTPDTVRLGPQPA